MLFGRPLSSAISKKKVSLISKITFYLIFSPLCLDFTFIICLVQPKNSEIILDFLGRENWLFFYNQKVLDI